MSWCNIPKRFLIHGPSAFMLSLIISISASKTDGLKFVVSKDDFGGVVPYLEINVRCGILRHPTGVSENRSVASTTSYTTNNT